VSARIRLLRDSDSATRTLAAWTGYPIGLDVVNRCDDRLTATEFADLDVPPDERCDQRVQARCLTDLKNPQVTSRD
jgi:hypothetical protein